MKRLTGNLVCSNCGSDAEVRIADRYRYTGAGLDNVFIKNAEIVVCPKCGNEELAIRNMAQIHELIAKSLAKRETSLNPKEFRFLRKHLGISAKQAAEAFSVTPETFSRWENGGLQLNDMAERLVRSLMFIDGARRRAVIEEFRSLHKPGYQSSIEVDQEAELCCA